MLHTNSLGLLTSRILREGLSKDYLSKEQKHTVGGGVIPSTLFNGLIQACGISDPDFYLDQETHRTLYSHKFYKKKTLQTSLPKTICIILFDFSPFPSFFPLYFLLFVISFYICRASHDPSSSHCATLSLIHAFFSAKFSICNALKCIHTEISSK